MLSTMRTPTMYVCPICTCMYVWCVHAIKDENTHHVCPQWASYQRWEHTPCMSTVSMLWTMRTHTMYVHSVHVMNNENTHNVCPQCTWYQRWEHTKCMSTVYMISTTRTYTMYVHNVHDINDENTHNVYVSTAYLLSTMRTHTMYVYSVHAIAGRQRPLLDSLHVLRTTHQFFEVLWHQIVFHGNTSVSTPTLFPQICKWINGTRRSVPSRLPVSRKLKQSRTINRPPNVHWLNPC